jgi:hypothetical protein
MRLYTRLWQGLCVLLAAVGASVAFVQSPVAMTFVFIYFGIFGMLLTPGFVGEYWELSRGGRMRLLAGGAVVGGSAACSFVGFASLLGLGVFLLTVEVVATSPYAVVTLRRGLGAARRSRCWEAFAHACAFAHPHYVSRPQNDLSTLTDQQLCQLWRASYLALLHAPARQMSAIAEQRQRYLDEFERRNRTGFAAWLGSGPLASASPMPYRVGVPTVDWDDLTREQES